MKLAWTGRNADVANIKSQRVLSAKIRVHDKDKYLPFYIVYKWYSVKLYTIYLLGIVTVLVAAAGGRGTHTHNGKTLHKSSHTRLFINWFISLVCVNFNILCIFRPILAVACHVV